MIWLEFETEHCLNIILSSSFVSILHLQLDSPLQHASLRLRPSETHTPNPIRFPFILLVCILLYTLECHSNNSLIYLLFIIPATYVCKWSTIAISISLPIQWYNSRMHSIYHRHVVVMPSIRHSKHLHIYHQQNTERIIEKETAFLINKNKVDIVDNISQEERNRSIKLSINISRRIELIWFV